MNAPLRNCSLRLYNSFGMEQPAAALVEVHSEEDVREALRNPDLPRPFHVLGGGSNVLLTKPFGGTVLLNRISGTEVIEEEGDMVLLRVGAGVNWHQFVMDTLDRGLSGVENLALIPGTVGASPIQNIGAYGVEVKDVIQTVRFLRFEDCAIQELDNEDCCFGYRDSIFKGAMRTSGVVTSVVFRLSKIASPKTTYGAIRSELNAAGITSPTPRDVANAVIAIRRSKLPDPAIIGNAGSFFKNPTIPQTQFESLAAAYPEMPHYPAGEGLVKIPAGWLIEQRGWKGASRGPAGVHDRQALVLVNRGGARGSDIWALSEEIVQDIQAHFGIALEREVQVW